MRQWYEISVNGLKVQTSIPLQVLYRVEIEYIENEHGKCIIKATVDKKNVQMILQSSFCEHKIVVINNDNKILFNGIVERSELEIENCYVVVTILGLSRTVLLDRNLKRRSFQNTNMTYMQIINKIVSNYENINLTWYIAKDKRIEYPIIQYDETDWEFIKRLSSHLNSVVYANDLGEEILFSIGCREGKEREESLFDFLKYGNTDCENKSRRKKKYIEIETYESWNLGDFIYVDGFKYKVYRKFEIFTKGEMIHRYTLGEANFVYVNKLNNKKLKGISLAGIIKKTEKENIYIQLDIDNEETANYKWDWRPENGNLCYCMPEIGVKAWLYFPSEEEKDGLIVHIFPQYKNDIKCNKEFSTLHDKNIGLYMEKIFLGTNKNNTLISLEDKNGTYIKSNKLINLISDQDICITGAKWINKAYYELLIKASNSSIGINRDLNFYALNGVYTKGIEDSRTQLWTDASMQQKKVDHWQISYSALAALPAFNFKRNDDDSVVDMIGCGAIPKIASGKVTFALKDKMEGKKEDKIKFADALQDMELYMKKGGHAILE